MMMRFLFGSALFAACSTLVWDASADPILPYSQPVSVQLTNDLNGGSPAARTLEKALQAYHKTSKNLRGDTTILRNLNNLLGEVSGYAPLLADATSGYQADFQVRRDEITAQLIPAPISANKTAARTALTRVNNSLSNAVLAATTAKRIQHLQSAAQRLAAASNNVQRALRTKPGLSQMAARIGKLSFNATKGEVVGGGNFYNNVGGTIGEFSEDGVLSVSAVDSGSVTRGLHLHLTGVSSAFPATYALGVGDNRGFYDATDLRRKQEYHFQVDPGLTDEVVTNSSVTIEYIGTNSLFLSDTSSIPVSGYILGRFAFVGTNVSLLNTDTNRSHVTVSAGEFQLNFDIAPPSTNAPDTAPR